MLQSQGVTLLLAIGIAARTLEVLVKTTGWPTLSDKILFGMKTALKIAMAVQENATRHDVSRGKQSLSNTLLEPPRPF